MEQLGPRDTLPRWADAKGPDGLVTYRDRHNRYSIDGPPTPLAAG
jgi:hypothetical protein